MPRSRSRSRDGSPGGRGGYQQGGPRPTPSAREMDATVKTLVEKMNERMKKPFDPYARGLFTRSQSRSPPPEKAAPVYKEDEARTKRFMDNLKATKEEPKSAGAKKEKEEAGSDSGSSSSSGA